MWTLLQHTKMELLLVTTLLLAVATSKSARILVLHPSNVKSHVIVTDPLFEELASRGHEVTLVTNYPHDPPLPNLKEIDVSHTQPVTISNFSYQEIQEGFPNPFSASLFMTDLEVQKCDNILSLKALQGLIHSGDKFDLVMAEIFIVDCFAPFAHKFKAPLVSFVTSSALPWVADRVGLPDNPSYIPNYFAHYSPDMTTHQRIHNWFLLVFTKLIYNYYIFPKTQTVVNKHFGDTYPPLETLINNTSLVLVNSHFTLSQSRPFPPNLVEIGGIHLRNSSKSLPQDLKNILDQSHKGVILMSFGSLVRISSIPKHIIKKFLNVFAALPQTVILKYEEDLAEAPPNVVTRKWLPQQEIMGHKNVKALIAHGGQATIIEAVNFGKPLIGIPFFADQYLNIQMVVSKGAGIMLDLESLSEEDVAEAVKEVLHNPLYAEKAKSLSEQFNDRPQSALQSAVYWTEYVIKHNGAHHLRPASVRLALYQYLLLDVLLVILLSTLLLVYIVYFATKYTIALTQRKKSSRRSRKKKTE